MMMSCSSWLKCTEQVRQEGLATPPLSMHLFSVRTHSVDIRPIHAYMPFPQQCPPPMPGGINFGHITGKNEITKILKFRKKNFAGFLFS
jgi:hypothetical protein